MLTFEITSSELVIVYSLYTILLNKTLVYNHFMIQVGKKMTVLDKNFKGNLSKTNRHNILVPRH